jgi:hypothetical protein
VTTGVGEEAPRNRYFRRKFEFLQLLCRDGREGEMRDAELRDVFVGDKLFH